MLLFVGANVESRDQSSGGKHGQGRWGDQQRQRLSHTSSVIATFSGRRERPVVCICDCPLVPELSRCLSEMLDEPVACGATRMVEVFYIGVKMPAIQNHQAFGFKRAIIRGKGFVGHCKMVVGSNQH